MGGHRRRASAARDVHPPVGRDAAAGPGSDSLALQVLVTTVMRDAQITQRPARRSRLPGEALLATVRTRTSRQDEE